MIKTWQNNNSYRDQLDETLDSHESSVYWAWERKLINCTQLSEAYSHLHWLFKLESRYV